MKTKINKIVTTLIFLTMLFSACTTETPVEENISTTTSNDESNIIIESNIISENTIESTKQKTQVSSIKSGEPELLVENDYKYIILSDGTAQIERYTGDEDGLLDIPSSLNGYTVTKIGMRAFASNSMYSLNFTEVSIPDSVIEIKAQAFDSCKNLSNISIPESVKKFGDRILNETPFLENYESDLLIVNNCLIGYKGNDENVIIPDSVIEITPRAFYNCENLISVTIPDNGIIIGYEAFIGCINLANINIPESVTEIGYDAFFATKFLSNEENKLYVTVNNILIFTAPEFIFGDEILPESLGIIKIGGGAFSRNEKLKSITIPDGVEIICERAFSKCLYLKNIIIPDSVTKIEEDAFLDCINLKILCSEGSYAHKYSIENNIEFEII